MIEVAATLYTIETLVSWFFGIIGFIIIGILIYYNLKFEQSRKK